jgi:hypothetical protein
MNYHGPLFGKIGRRHILLTMTSEDVDRLKHELALAQSANSDVARIAQERDDALELVEMLKEARGERPPRHVVRALEKQLAESRAIAEKLAEALQCQQDAEEWIENADPESAFFEATLSLMLNSAADMRKETLAAHRAARANVRLARPLPQSGEANCPECLAAKSVARHNADWTCHKCGFCETADPETERAARGKEQE